MSDFFRVVSHHSDYFDVQTDSGIVSVRARGKLRRGDLLVGDFVKLSGEGNDVVISQIRERENSLIRPSVANIDIIVIVIAPKPEPDLYLVDKLIINCKRAGIDCLLCLNKSDIASDNALNELKEQYASDVSAVVSVSASNGDVSSLLQHLNGKLICFAGQSAVGKSTLSNAILGGNFQKIGDLSEKIGRGKNTTTSASIMQGDGFSFIDTPGFSMLDVFEPEYEALAGYYDEYVRLADKCKFHPCSHTTEPDCAVKSAVADGKVNKDRYDRYLRIYEESKAAYKRKRR